MQRTKEGFEAPEEPKLPTDYVVVGTEWREWYVRREMAQFVDGELDRNPLPRWTAFVDMTGARVRVRSRLIEYVLQCTVEQRALARPIRTGMKTGDCSRYGRGLSDRLGRAPAVVGLEVWIAL
jgi:hypothetical protein